MVTHGFVIANGVKLHYAEEGNGQVMLFLHGFPEFWYAWKDQLSAFGKTHRAIALDMRGYNVSDKPPKVEDYALPLLIADIKAFLETVSKGKKAILVAHDWGGAIAWAYAAHHPQTLEKLVIINGPHPTVFARELANNPAQKQASSYMEFFRSEGAEKALSANKYAGLVGAVFGSSKKPESFTPQDRKAYLDAWAQPGALTGGLNYYRANRFGADPVPKITLPTLVLWGEKDTALLLGNLEGLDQLVSSLTIQRIPGASHWVVHEEPEVITKAIRAFMTSAPPAP